MPISFSEFKNGYSIVGVDLTSCQDSHLGVLPLRLGSVASCVIEFSNVTVDGFLLFIGEFRNEIKVGLKTPARMLHNY